MSAGAVAAEASRATEAAFYGREATLLAAASRHDEHALRTLERRPSPFRTACPQERERERERERETSSSFSFHVHISSLIRQGLEAACERLGVLRRLLAQRDVRLRKATLRKGTRVLTGKYVRIARVRLERFEIRNCLGDPRERHSLEIYIKRGGVLRGLLLQDAHESSP